MQRIVLLLFGLGLALAPPLAAAPVRVVTTLPVYASIAESVGGERVEASAISRADEDAHFVKPKPSFALLLKQADLFVTTGLDLELWAPLLIDKSGNRKIRQGAPGWVSASRGVPLAGIPETLDRSGGDVHIYGNPHIFTSPLNAKIVAANIVAGLQRVDSAAAALYDEHLHRFLTRINEALYGAELVKLLGADTLDALTQSGTLTSFLASRKYQGSPLIERLGGWMGRARGLRGCKIVAYHKNWLYFVELFGLQVIDYVEPKPGIPPSARRVHELITRVAANDVHVLLAASYFGTQRIETIARRLGVRPFIVPLGPGGSAADAAGPGDYFALVDLWIDGLSAACGT